MSNKEELFKKIKEWIASDDRLKLLQKEIKEIRALKKDLTDELLVIMKNNDIDCFDVNENKLIFCQNKVKAPINKKTLLENLENFFKNYPKINPEEVTNFVLENRDVKINENIRRK